MVFQNNIRLKEGKQRRVALRTAMDYWRVSTAAIQVIAGTISVYFLALEKQRPYIRTKSDKELKYAAKQKKIIANDRNNGKNQARKGGHAG